MVALETQPRVDRRSPGAAEVGSWGVVCVPKSRNMVGNVAGDVTMPRRWLNNAAGLQIIELLAESLNVTNDTVTVTFKKINCYMKIEIEYMKHFKYMKISFFI